MPARAASYVVVVLGFTAHVAFIAFFLLGGFLAWAWPGLLVPHVLTAAWGAWVMGWHRPCPLTALENRGRRGAGMAALPAEGFVDHYLTGRLYPRRWTPAVHALAFVVVLASWIGYAVWQGR